MKNEVLRKVVLAVCIIGVVLGIAMSSAFTTMFIVGCKEIGRREGINADCEVLGKVIKCVENSEDNYSPIFEYTFNGSVYSIESEYIIYDTEEEALKCKDVTVKINSHTEESYIEECRNINGQEYSMKSVQNKSFIFIILGILLLTASLIIINKLVYK